MFISFFLNGIMFILDLCEDVLLLILQKTYKNICFHNNTFIISCKYLHSLSSDKIVNCIFNNKIYIKYNYKCCNYHNFEELFIFNKIERSIKFLLQKNKQNINLKNSDFIYCKNYRKICKVCKIINNFLSNKQIKFQRYPSRYVKLQLLYRS